MSSNPVTIGDERDTIRSSGIPVLLFFHAPWCVPCVKLEQVINKISIEFRERVNIVSLDMTVDGSRMIANEWGIKSVPTLILFNKGQLVEQISPSKGESGIREALDKVLVDKVFCR